MASPTLQQEAGEQEAVPEGKPPEMAGRLQRRRALPRGLVTNFVYYFIFTFLLLKGASCDKGSGDHCGVTLSSAAADSVQRLPVTATEDTELVAKGFKDEQKFTDTRIDPFYWLQRDSVNGTASNVALKAIKAENEYSSNFLAITSELQAKLVQEFSSRQPAGQRTAPLRSGSWYYYSYRKRDDDYFTHARRPATGPALGKQHSEVEDIMDEKKGAAEEQVVLDENVEAEHAMQRTGSGYFETTPLQVSDDGNLIAYGVDTKGMEQYTLVVKDLRSGEAVTPEPLSHAASPSLAWAPNNSTLFYCTQDEGSNRPSRVWRARPLDSSAQPVLVHAESDEAYKLEVRSVRSRHFVHVVGSSNSANYHYLIPTDDLEGKMLKVVPSKAAPAARGLEAHGEYVFLIGYDANHLINGQLVILRATQPDKFKVLKPHEADVLLEDLAVWRGYLAVQVRVRGRQEVWVYALPRNVNLLFGLPPTPDLVISFDDVPNHAIQMPPRQPGGWGSGVMRITLRSMLHPLTTLDVDLATGKRVVKHVDEMSGYRPEAYVQERHWAPAHDGVLVPVSLASRQGALDGSGRSPVLIRAYGAYGRSFAPEMHPEDLSLMDRGFVIAIAHVRGGQELGGTWYADGQLLKKENTFKDLVAVAEYLIESGHTHPDSICLWGTGAGGLTVGATITMHPSLFKCAVLEAPFLDVLTTMRDPGQPMVAMQRSELGDPLTSAEYYRYIKGYSPQDNVRPGPYPTLLISTGLHDPRVAFWEPVKFAAKLRAAQSNTLNPVLLQITESGHRSESTESGRVRDVAEKVAFLLLAVGRACSAPKAATSGGGGWAYFLAICLALLLAGGAVGGAVWLGCGGEARRAAVAQGMRRAVGMARDAARDAVLRAFPGSQGYSQTAGDGDDDDTSDGDTDGGTSGNGAAGGGMGGGGAGPQHGRRYSGGSAIVLYGNGAGRFRVEQDSDSDCEASGFSHQHHHEVPKELQAFRVSASKQNKAIEQASKQDKQIVQARKQTSKRSLLSLPSSSSSSSLVVHITARTAP